MISPISLLIHNAISNRVKTFKNASFILDMGGTGKLNELMPDKKIINANINSGIDCTNLPYPDEKFDLTVSIATLEHVFDYEKFIFESIRTSKYGSIHWFPCGTNAEKIELLRKEKWNLKHDCVIPSISDIGNIVKDYPFTLQPFISCDSLLLSLAYIYNYQNIDIYETMEEYENKEYGYILEIMK